MPKHFCIDSVYSTIVNSSIDWTLINWVVAPIGLSVMQYVVTLLTQNFIFFPASHFFCCGIGECRSSILIHTINAVTDRFKNEQTKIIKHSIITHTKSTPIARLCIDFTTV